MLVVMLFALGMVAQTATAPATTGSKAACACCGTASAAMKDCCHQGKGCAMKDGKMACTKDCCKDMAQAKSCCKDGKCEMAKGKSCCGASCKMSKAS